MAFSTQVPIHALHICSLNTQKKKFQTSVNRTFIEHKEREPVSRHSQYPTVDRLQTVANIGQSPAEQDGHGVSHVSLSGLLVELGGDNPAFISSPVLQQNAAVSTQALGGVVVTPPGLDRADFPGGRNGREEARVREGAAEPENVGGG